MAVTLFVLALAEEGKQRDAKKEKEKEKIHMNGQIRL